MARTVTEIQQQIFANITANEDLATLNSTSKVAIYRLIVFAVSYAVWTLEQLFDIHSAQVDKAIYENKPGTARWYRNMSLAFQFGFNLLTDDDEFDNTGHTTDEIEASKIVRYCSVKESLESSRLIIKIAGESGDDLIPLTLTQITSFGFYMGEVAYAGVKVNIVNNPADKLNLTLRVYRNPLVIDENGNNILTGGKSVEIALKQYIKNLPFDGELVINDMIDYLRDVPGIENVHVISAQSSYKDLVTGLYTPFVTIDVKTIPVAGYFEIPNFDNVSYVV
ncbi:nucleotidyltransferase [Flavobacterium sp.]|uniref:nucleotidyltransferase n=1 Tax=Flavobacterium sp. TaxID=239 RepID=UPI00375064AA